MNDINIFTIGFTKKSAKEFFTKLKNVPVRRVIDVRLNNVSQLAGFSKKEDLEFFLKAICDINYSHTPLLAPTQDILDEYKKAKGDWSVYERKFLNLMEERKIEEKLLPNFIDGGCLLCSEDKPHYCHRRLVAEYLKSKWVNVKINHLM